MNNFNYGQQKTQFSSYYNPTTTNNIIWVQGIEGAKAWQLAPNSMVILLDSEVEGKMYIKVSDNIGMSNLRIFNYVEEILPKTSNPANNNLDLSQFVTKEELKNIVKEIIDEQFISTVATPDEQQQPAVTKYDKPQPKVILSASSTTTGKQ